MADAHETNNIIRELNNPVIYHTDETKHKQSSFSCQQEVDDDDIPPSLLSYFETSKSRAAVFEKLILEEPEDFTVSQHTDDTMNVPFESIKYTMNLNEQIICETENDENTTTNELLPAPAETDLLLHHRNEDKDGTKKSMDSEKRCAFEIRTLEIPLNEKERWKSSEYEAERAKRLCEEMKKEEQKRQIERDFQEELKKIIEEEKIHQKELELMGKRAQEKLEQEFLLQQELINNTKRQVEKERRMREEEQKRWYEEEERRKKEEVERKIMEEEKKRTEEQRNKCDLEKKKRKKKKKRKTEEEISLKKEQEWRKNIERERGTMEEETMEIEAEGGLTKETEERRKQEEMRGGKEEVEADERKKMAQEVTYEEIRKGDKREQGQIDENTELEEWKQKEAKNQKEETGEEIEKGRNREMEIKRLEKKMGVTEVIRKQEGNEEEPLEEDKKRRNEDESRAREEEGRRRQMEETRGQRDDEGYRKPEQEQWRAALHSTACSLPEHKERKDGEMWGDKETDNWNDVDNRYVEGERKTKDNDIKQEEEEEEEEEKRKREDERGNPDPNLGVNRVEVDKKTEEEMTLKAKEESRMDKETEDREVKANELQEKGGHNSENRVKTGSSQPEGSTAWTSTSPGPSHGEPSPCHTEDDTTQTCTDNHAARPSGASLSILVCLPEHTERKRLSWMKDCIPWSKLSFQNQRKQKGKVQSRRGQRRAAEVIRLPPLCPDSLLQSTGCRSLQEVTTVTLEDLPGCSLSTLAQCSQLRSLTLRRCGLKSLEGIKHLTKLCYIDVQENDITFVDCDTMSCLRVLQLGHNKLTSIHGLAGAENLDVLDLSHNSITRIAGLESVRRLQRLSLAHNQLISTKGLKDVYTLLHLNCSHNHLASVEALENSALLNTLDLRANSLTEPPCLSNQVLLRELHLDDNSISSLQGLAACWLPLMRHFSVAQNRITQLPPMSDFVSLVNMDLGFNCMSELQNLCKSLAGCQFLQEVRLAGNPLQQESDWRSTLQKTVPGLRAIDDQETDLSLSPPAVQRLSLASGSFVAFCQAQLQQTCDLQRQHSRELSHCSSSLDAIKTSCRHFTEVLHLAMDQRFAHEYGDTTVANKQGLAGQTTPEEMLDVDTTQEMQTPGKVANVTPNGDSAYSHCAFVEKSAAESLHDTFSSVRTDQTGSTVSKANSGSVDSLARETSSSSHDMAPESNHQDLDLQIRTAAIVIQQRWREYRQKCRIIGCPSTTGKVGGRGGDGGKPGPSYVKRSVVQDYAATVIQAFWRGFSLRRRLASALAAVADPDAGEDDTFEEVDMDEFVFDEAEFEKCWKLPLSEDSPLRHHSASAQPLSPKPPGPSPEPSKYILPPQSIWRSKQAWVAAEQEDSPGQKVSPVSSNRSKSPASASVVSDLSEKYEKIQEEWGFTHSHTALLMLERAKKMTSKRQPQNKHQDPLARLAMFKKCSHPPRRVDARNRQAQHNKDCIRAHTLFQPPPSIQTEVQPNQTSVLMSEGYKVGEAELGLQPAEKTERVKQEHAQQRLHIQAAHADRDSESVHFLPEISADILNGGRVQLVCVPSDPEYTGRHARGPWANGSLASQPARESNCPRKNPLGHARDELPCPQRVTSAPSKRERISFRDNPVQLSGGWGGGKRRDKKVYK